MANRAGLRKVTKSVKGKKGTVQRSYWVKASSAVKGAAKSAGKFIGKHKGKIAAGAGLALTAAAAYKGAKFVKGYRGMGMSHGDAAKAIFGGLKDRAKGVPGSIRSAISDRKAKRADQKAHRSAAAGAAMPSARERVSAAVSNAGKRIRSAAANVKAGASRMRKGSRQLSSGS